jgi:hypothetical protein
MCVCVWCLLNDFKQKERIGFIGHKQVGTVEETERETRRLTPSFDIHLGVCKFTSGRTAVAAAGRTDRSLAARIVVVAE